MSEIQSAAARMSRAAAETLAANLEAVPAEKQDWRPLDAGRSALSQVQECAVINAFFAAILRTRAVPEMEYEARTAALGTAEKALAALRASGAELGEVIEAFPTEDLGGTIVLPFGPGMTMTYGQVMFAAYWNMTYHEGQIAYIQTLYGDTAMHGMPQG